MLEAENTALQALTRKQEELRVFADDPRKAGRECDPIIQAAEKIKHQQEVKPKHLQKALNTMSSVENLQECFQDLEYLYFIINPQLTT